MSVSPIGIALVNVACGAAVHLISSFTRSAPFGVAPTLAECALLAIAYCTFILYYELADVMGSGIGGGANFHEKNPSELTRKQIYHKRAQMNQVEQFPVFLCASASSALLVDARLTGVLSLAWVLLRMQYSRTYRRNAEKERKGIGTYTVPCYMIVGTLAGSTGVAGVRLLLGV